MEHTIQMRTGVDYNHCPIRQVLSKFTDKWSILILDTLNLNAGISLRYNEIKKQIPDCSQKMLSQTLRHLEEANLIIRTAYPEVPPRVEYCLSNLGKSLMPHLTALTKWAIDNFEKVVRQ